MDTLIKLGRRLERLNPKKVGNLIKWFEADGITFVDGELIEELKSMIPKEITWESTVFSKHAKEIKSITETISKTDFVPEKKDIFNALKLTPLNRVRVVIIGQDPYHSKDIANGLAFSVKKGVKIPPSLRNIFKEIKNEYPKYKISQSGDLTPWAKQGVLLLNTSLTTIRGTAAAHKGVWDKIVKVILTAVTEVNPKCIWVLWGAHAQALRKQYQWPTDRVLISSHPSPLSARHGFEGNGHFKMINKLLKSNPIDWNT